MDGQEVPDWQQIGEHLITSLVSAIKFAALLAQRHSQCPGYWTGDTFGSFPQLRTLDFGPVF